jgi:hypothetical protein
MVLVLSYFLQIGDLTVTTNELQRSLLHKLLNELFFIEIRPVTAELLSDLCLVPFLYSVSFHNAPRPVSKIQMAGDRHDSIVYSPNVGKKKLYSEQYKRYNLSQGHTVDKQVARQRLGQH